MKFSANHEYVPEKCWVGEQQKICYDTRENAEQSARLVEFEHHLKPHSLRVYKCEFGNHWHIANKKAS